MMVALLGVLLLTGLAAGFMLVVPTDLAAATKNRIDTEASLAADAGVRDSMAWIAHTLANAGEPCNTVTPSPVRTGSLGNWDWSCQIEADPQTPPNGIDTIRLYRLTSRASRDGGDRWQIVAWVQAGQSFAEFGEFTDLSSGGLWDVVIGQGWKSEGPVHHNGVLRMYISQSYFTGPAPATPAIDGRITSSGVDASSPDGIHYYSSSNAPYSYGDGYDRLVTGGLSEVQAGVAPIPMPTSAIAQASAAWGGNPPPAPPAGVTVNPAGGVFIDGDVDAMTMNVNGSGNFVLTIVQAGQTTTVEEDSVSSTRIVTPPSGAPVTVPGMGTGVIFSNGNIASFSGTNKNAHTVAVDHAALKNIVITGDILRADTPDGSKPTSTSDRLGIVANRVEITGNTALIPRNSTDPLSLYATIMARDRLSVQNATTSAPGRMAIYGGISSGHTPDYNLFNPADGTTLAGMGGLNGYGTPNIIYDATLANEPPPRFPTTAGSDLSIRYWHEAPL
ncbi:MAG: hypothetical protein AB7S38_27770 [Vulcanimicrobiota bacterium]